MTHETAPPDDPVSVADSAAEKAMVPGLLDDRYQLPLLLAAVSAGIALTVAPPGADPAVARLYGAFLIVYPALVLAGQVELPLVGARVDRFVDEWTREGGKGFYGVMGLTLFLKREAAFLYDDVVEVLRDGISLPGTILGWFAEFVVQSAFNLLYALIWPLHLVMQFGYGQALLAGAFCWACFWLGNRLFSTPAWLLEND